MLRGPALFVHMRAVENSSSELQDHLSQQASRVNAEEEYVPMASTRDSETA